MVYYCTLTTIFDKSSQLFTLLIPRTKHEYLWTPDDNTQPTGSFTRQNNKLLHGF